jgi:endonuclease I
MLPSPQLSTLAAALLWLATLAPAQGYYSSVDDSDAYTLRTTLHELIDDHQRFPYTSSSTDTWDILKIADQDPSASGRIIDLYRNESYVKANGGNNDYNREHSWPNSYGFPDDNPDNYPYTDCHQLFLCDIGYNSARGSRAYADVPGGREWPTVANNGIGGGSGVYPGNSDWGTSNDGSSGSWETWSERRGDVARAMFYMDVRYEGGTHGGTGSAEPDLILTDNRALMASSQTGNNESVAYMGLLSVLLQWHQLDPPDALEIARNDTIFGYQGNRNPFVDHPEWVDCLYGNSCGTVSMTADANSINLATGATVTFTLNAGTQYAGQNYRVLGSTEGTVPGFPYSGIDIPLNPTGTYFWDTVNQTSLYLNNDAGVLDLNGQAVADFSLPPNMPAWLDGWVVSHAFVVVAPSGSSLDAASNPVDIALMAGGGSGGQLVINEVDYDQAGTDTDEYIEIYNAGSGSADLSNVVLELWNGSGLVLYNSIDLSSAGASLSAGGYLVIGSASVVSTLPPGTLSITFSQADNNVQNGGSNGDGMKLIDSATTTVLDAMSYEAIMTGITEGSDHAGEDLSSSDFSLSRMPNGTDSDQNGLDFIDNARLTPGADNQ